MDIRQVASLEELAVAWAFIEQQFAIRTLNTRNLAHYIEHFKMQPDFLLIAEEEGQIHGAAFASGRVDSHELLVGEVVVDSQVRNQGIGTALLTELERRARDNGKRSLLLGALSDAERFYLKMGFKPLLFIQVFGPGSAATLQYELANRLSVYPVTWRDETSEVSKAIVVTPTLKADLQQALETEVPDCHTQYLFTKEV